MNGWLKTLAVGATSTLIACGGSGGSGGDGDGDPLEGTWVEGASGQTEAFRYTFVLHSNGKASVEDVVVNPPAGETCSGTSHFDDLKWSHTKTTLTISGSNCSGKIVCRDATSASEYKCFDPPREQRIECTYSLSADEDTLDVSEFQDDKVTLGPATFERMK